MGSLDIQSMESIWTEVCGDYIIGSINSEHCLQASLYHHMRAGECRYKVLVEPLITISGDQYYPDLMLVREGQILAVFELKFVPHGYPVYESDITKFNVISGSGCQDGHKLSILPESGNYDDIGYHFADETKYVFVVIGQHDSNAAYRDVVTKKLKPELSDRFYLWSGKVGGETGFQYEVQSS